MSNKGQKLGLLLASSLVLCGCGNHNESKESTPVSHSVVLTKMQTTGTERTKKLTGIVKESREIELGFKIAGQIATVNVKEGDYVKEGQLIATLDSKDYRLELNQIQIQYAQTQRQVERMRKLKDSKSISGNDFDKAQSGLEELGVQLQACKNKVAYTRLYAPISGYVQSVNFEKAEMVNTGTPIIKMLDTQKMEVEVNLPTSIYENKDLIRSIKSRSSLNPDKEWPMKLVSIVPKADGNQLYQMTLSFAQTPDKRISSGMNIEVNLELKGAKGKSCEQTLPIHAIYKTNGKEGVWIVKTNQTLTFKEVKVKGIDDQGDAIIESDLTGDENIVKAGVEYLHEGEKVKVVEEPSDTNVGGLM